MRTAPKSPLSISSRGAQDRRIEAVAVPDDELHARLARRRDHRAAFVERDRDRLLDQHMLAVRGRGGDMPGMNLVRRGDIDRLDVRIGAQLLDRVVGRARRSPAANCARASGRGSVAATSAMRGSAAKVGSIRVKARPSPATPSADAAARPCALTDRSRVPAIFARETQIMIWLPRSCSVSTRSRWSASPASSFVRQVPQVPLSQELGTS